MPEAFIHNYITNGRHCKGQRSPDPDRWTDPILRGSSNPEEEDDQRCGQQLPDEQNHPEHHVAGVPE